MNEYMRACLRFWWVLVIGVGVAGLATYGVAKSHKGPSYSSSLQLMVDSPTRPFLRTNVTTVTQQPAKTQVQRVPARNGKTTTYQTQAVTVPQPPSVATQTPDTKALIDAANLYPTLIESDAVSRLRTKLFGEMPGFVSAQAVFSAKTAQRFVPSTFPIISLSSESRSARAALNLPWATYFAFKKWLVSSQKASGVPAGQRIVVRPLQVPKVVAETKHTRNGLAVVIGLALLGGVIFFLVILDKLVPRRQREESEAKDSDTPGAAVPVPPEI